MTSALTSRISGNGAREYKEGKRAKKTARKGLLEIADSLSRSKKRETNGDTTSSELQLSSEFIARQRDRVNGSIWILIEQIAEMFPGRNTPKIIDAKLGDFEDRIRAVSNVDQQDIDALTAKIAEVRSKVMSATITGAELAS